MLANKSPGLFRAVENHTVHAGAIFHLPSPLLDCAHGRYDQEGSSVHTIIEWLVMRMLGQ